MVHPRGLFLPYNSPILPVPLFIRYFAPISGPVAGALTSRFGYRAVVILGGLVMTVGLAGASFCPDIYSLLVLYGLAGVGGGLSYIPNCIAGTHYFDQKYHGLVIGIVTAGCGFGQFLTPVVADLLARHYTWRGTLLIQAGISANIVISGAVLRPMPSMECDTTNAWSTHLFKDGYFLNFCFHAFTFTVGFSVTLVHLAHSVERFTNVGSDLSSMAISLMGLFMTAGKFAQPAVAKLKCVNPVLQTLASTAVAGALVFVIPHVTDFPTVAVLSAALGFFVSPYGSVMIIIVIGLVGQEHANVAYGYIGFVSGVGLYVGAPIAGALYDVTGLYRSSMYFGGGVIVLSAISLCWMTCRWRAILRSRRSIRLAVDREREPAQPESAILLNETQR